MIMMTVKSVDDILILSKWKPVNRPALDDVEDIKKEASL